MKKVITVLMALCLLCSAAALAETPTFESMPGMVIFDSFFEGSWEAGPVFANEIYVDLGDLAREYSLSIPMVTINADDLNTLADSVNTTRLNNNPVIFDKTELYNIYKSIAQDCCDS